MPPLSYALLNEVLQYPVKPEERISVEHNNNISQNTSIIEPNKNIYKRFCGINEYDISKGMLNGLNNVKEFFTQTGTSVEELLGEQIFLTKLILILLLLIFILNLVKK